MDGTDHFVMRPAIDGGPARPVEGGIYDGEFHGMQTSSAHAWAAGMSIRDEFAKAALQGLLSCPDTSGSKDAFAKDAYAYADAMLRARKPTPSGDEG